MILDNVKRLCEEKKISLYELEKACGIGNGTIARWGGDVKPNFSSLQKLAEYFGCKVSDLLDG